MEKKQHRRDRHPSEQRTGTHVRLQAAKLDLSELVLEPRIGHQNADVAGHVGGSVSWSSLSGDEDGENSGELGSCRARRKEEKCGAYAIATHARTRNLSLKRALKPLLRLPPDV